MTPQSLADKARARNHAYIVEKQIPREVELALALLFKEYPEHPVSWLATYYCKRAAEIGEPCSVAEQGPPRTLFQRLGGLTGVCRLVDMMYARVLADTRVGFLLNGLGVGGAKAACVADLGKALGCDAAGLPQGGEGISLEGQDEAVFEVLCAHLERALQDLGYAEDEVSGTVLAYKSLRNGPSLYDRIGGSGAVDVAVDQFYAKVLADDRVKHFFDGVDMRRQRMKQKSFLTYVFGGPNNYTSRNMRDGHRQMVKEKGLNDTHFDAIVELLASTLKDLGVTDADIGEVAKIAESVRDDVLCKGEGLEQKSLYDRIGGSGAVDVAVDQFYAKVLADDRVKHFFDGVDMRRQRMKQKSFLTYVFGGPNNYTSRNMRDGHRQMVKEKGLNDTHFDAIVELLASTLKDLGVTDADIGEVAKIAESVRDDVLCKGEGLEQKSLYDRIGGSGAVDVAVDQFYAKVLADDRVKHFFDGVDMRRQRMKQKSFLTYVFGGPNNYTSRNMRDGHRQMVKEKGLNDTHFDAIVELLASTLKGLGVTDADIGEVAKIAESVRDDVLCKGEGLEQKSLYDRIGGSGAVDVAVDQFYAKVLADDRVKQFFDGVDMRRQRMKQKSFLTYVFGGPNNYTSRNMRDGHRQMVKEKGLNDTHFDAIVELLASTLKDLGVTDADIGEVAKIAESVRDDVLCKGEGLEQKSLYDRIGGSGAVDVAVDQFYAKVLADDRVKHFFDGVDMRRQRMKQKSFLTYVFGGPNNYTSRNMRDGHRQMVKEKGLNDTHFDAIVELLASTLKDLGVTDADIGEVAKIAESVRDDVLCKGEGLEQKSLYDRIGGSGAVDVAVDQFYAKVLADDRVKQFFDGVDMRRQRMKQKSFLTYVFGGPNNYTSRNMRDGHRQMVKEKGLNDTHFDAIVELLASTLKGLGVTDADIGEVAKIAESVRDDVLCKGEGL